MTDATLGHMPDFYNHRRTEVEQAPLWEDGTPIPWMTYPAISYLNQLDFSDKQIFEYGCGGSTSYWANRSRRVISVEHDRDWFEKVKARSSANMEVLFATGPDYVNAIARDAPHDVIVIDGRWRYDCAMNCLGHLAHGGMVIVDNSERHPPITAFLRQNGLIQVDMIGYGPQNRYIWCTSLFLTRGFAFAPAKAIQPHRGPGMLDSIEAQPSHANLNKPGVF